MLKKKENQIRKMKQRIAAWEKNGNQKEADKLRGKLAGFQGKN